MEIDGKKYELVPVWSVESPISGQDDFLTAAQQYGYEYEDNPEPVGYLLKVVETS